MLFDPESARDLLDAVVAGFAVLAGVMAYYTGRAAAHADAIRASLDVTARQINKAMSDGYNEGTIFALVAIIMAVWT